MEWYAESVNLLELRVLTASNTHTSLRDGSSWNTPGSIVDMMLPERFLVVPKIRTCYLTSTSKQVQYFYGLNLSYSLVRLVNPWNMSAVRQPMRLLDRSLKDKGMCWLLLNQEDSSQSLRHRLWYLDSFNIHVVFVISDQTLHIWHAGKTVQDLSFIIK